MSEQLSLGDGEARIVAGLVVVGRTSCLVSAIALAAAEARKDCASTELAGKHWLRPQLHALAADSGVADSLQHLDKSLRSLEQAWEVDHRRGDPRSHLSQLALAEKREGMILATRTVPLEEHTAPAAAR